MKRSRLSRKRKKEAEADYRFASSLGLSDRDARKYADRKR